ncbi:MAG: hypothetical protein LBI27_09635 [Clostridiales bacterium]|jgi:TPR repeat protein|nr:hypothetical protein [Clostridiales bacterium]
MKRAVIGAIIGFIIGVLIVQASPEFLLERRRTETQTLVYLNQERAAVMLVAIVIGSAVLSIAFSSVWGKIQSYHRDEKRKRADEINRKVSEIRGKIRSLENTAINADNSELMKYVKEKEAQLSELSRIAKIHAESFFYSDDYFDEIIQELDQKGASLMANANQARKSKADKIVSEARALMEKATETVQQARLISQEEIIKDSSFYLMTNDKCNGAEYLLSNVLLNLRELEKKSFDSPIKDLESLISKIVLDAGKIDDCIGKLNAIKQEAAEESVQVEQIRNEAEIVTANIRQASESADLSNKKEKEKISTTFTNEINDMSEKLSKNFAKAEKMFYDITIPASKVDLQKKNNLLQKLKEMTNFAAEALAHINNFVIDSNEEREEKKKQKNSLLQEAQTGNSIAQFNLSMLHLADKEFSDFAEWIEKSAQNGYVTAQRQLGICYMDGIYSFAKNHEKSIVWFEKAGEQGDVDSQYDLGCFNNSDKERAIYWFEKAAVSNHAEARYKLGILYGEKSNEQKKLHWLEKAGNQGHAEALFALALHYEKTEPLKAFELFLKVYDKNKNPLAQIYMGAMYCEGRGVDFRPGKGGEFIAEGLKRYSGKLSKSMYRRLGELYLIGKTNNKQAKDLKNAIPLLEKSDIEDFLLRDYKEQLKEQIDKRDSEAKLNAELESLKSEIPTIQHYINHDETMAANFLRLNNESERIRHTKSFYKEKEKLERVKSRIAEIERALRNA